MYKYTFLFGHALWTKGGGWQGDALIASLASFARGNDWVAQGIPWSSFKILIISFYEFLLNFQCCSLSYLWIAYVLCQVKRMSRFQHRKLFVNEDWPAHHHEICIGNPNWVEQSLTIWVTLFLMCGITIFGRSLLYPKIQWLCVHF